jgi:transposase InsO family protein
MALRRNVQKRSRGSSSCFAMIITERSAESLTPFDSGVEFADGPERPQRRFSSPVSLRTILTSRSAKLGVTVLKSPPRSPNTNAVCERVIGTIRRECLDWLIPLTESHLRTVLQSWVRHYNTGRPHMALGPGVPDPPPVMSREAASTSHPHLREDWIVRARSILGGLHHEYFWAPAGAH